MIHAHTSIQHTHLLWLLIIHHYQYKIVKETVILMMNVDQALFVSNEQVMRQFLVVQERIILFGTGKIFV